MAVTVTKSADDKTQQAKSDKNNYLVEVDRDVCIGAASCVAIAANSFKLDEKNKVIILEGDWDSDEMLLAAAQSCPVFAIKIKDAVTGKQIFPEAV
jgi:ferredoxin